MTTLLGITMGLALGAATGVICVAIVIGELAQRLKQLEKTVALRRE